MNIHPEVFIDARKLRERLVRESERYGISLDRIDDRSVFEEMEEIRKLGVRLALDDVGIAYSHLPFIDKIRPSFLKISQHFGTAFETDSTKMKIVANLQSLARDFDCDLILEGIEHASTAEMAASMNIKFGQGFFFGRPAEAASLLV
jgi:EAL domain-containing protein (putative c-di-GMP-specific phosphodiesterase class I)